MFALICWCTLEALFANIMFPDKTYLWSSLVRIHSVCFGNKRSLKYMYILTHTSIAKCFRSLIKLQTRSCLNDCNNILFAHCKGGNSIFISGLGLASSSAKEGKSHFIYSLVKSKSAFWDTQA